MQTAQSRRTYDHRIKQAILESGDRNLFPELKIPESTVRSWIHRGVSDAVTSDLVDCDRSTLVAEIHALRQRAALLSAVVGLLVTMIRVSKNHLDHERIRANRAAACGVCKSDTSSAALQLRRSQVQNVVRRSSGEWLDSGETLSPAIDRNDPI